MVEIGYKLSSEEHGPLDLVCYARQAEEASFSFASISDHYHPWIDAQGQSPFVWCTLGGISQVTSKMNITTGATCPTVRIHPAIIAQAAATSASMMPGRFTLALGSGENLNEHILGDRWPPAPIRIDMLEEAVDVIRLLWQGGMQDYHGYFYVVENAKIYTLPKELPSIIVAASGEIAAEAAGRIGDGLMTVGANKQIIEVFNESGGRGKPVYAECTVSWAKSENDAKRLAYEQWPTPANQGELGQELPVPQQFEALQKMVTPEDVVKNMAYGPDPQRYVDKVNEYVTAGVDHIVVHQIGQDQAGFIQFFAREVMPKLNF